MKLLIKFPTRQRPDKFKETLNRYYKNLSGKHDVSFLITCDKNDGTMNNEDMKAWLDYCNNLTYVFGTSRCKIEAVNNDMEHAGEYDIILLASDDMLPQVQGYDNDIITNMQKYYPDTFGVLHFNDGVTGRGLNTLCILGKRYYDYFGYIYHPDYISLWCDNEFQKVSETMHKATYIDKVIIKHEWVNHTGADDLHKKNESWYGRDHDMFKQREACGFPLESIRTIL